MFRFKSKIHKFQSKFKVSLRLGTEKLLELAGAVLGFEIGGTCEKRAESDL